MITEKYKVGGMSCAACSTHVEKAVKSVDGVSDVAVSLLTNSMSVTYDNPASQGIICEAVSKAGYSAKPEKESSSAPSNEKTVEDNETPKIIRRLVISLVLLIPLMYMSMGYAMWNWWLPQIMADNPMTIALSQLLITTVILVVNRKFFISGFKGAVHGAPNMDTLVALGSGAAYIYGIAVMYQMCVAEHQAHYLHELYFESAAMILALITLGKMLESYSKGKTTNAIKSLMDLAPKTANIIRDGQEVNVPVSEVKKGDIFIVRPGENIPVDGEVIEGESAVNEAALTGESIPSDKTVGNMVSAATINQHGFLKCRTLRVGADTTLSHIIEMVENASSTKAPIAKAADRVSAVFVPAVMAIAVITFVVWLIVGESIGFATARAISVLVISCPCALGLATPVAIMVGSGVGAKKGVLFKTAASLEAAGKTDIIILDKTGTITEGKPEVTEYCMADGVSEKELFETALALESKSEHPLSKAVIKKAVELGIEAGEADEFTILPGHGLSAGYKGVEAIGGNAQLMKDRNISDEKLSDSAKEYALSGYTPLFFAKEGRLLGVIAVADIVKPDSREAIEEFSKMGIETIMLTGDNEKTAHAIAAAVGIEHVVSDVLPNDKEAVVRDMMKYGRVAMVGDGINDAPALTRADTGIAIGAGSDIAIDSADVVLMRSSLKDVGTAIRLSKKTLKNIHENLFWAFIYNVIGIPIAAGVFIVAFGLKLNPMLGAAAMSLSSVCVVTNALRLNFFKDKTVKGSKRVNLPKINKMEENKMEKTVLIEGMMCENCVAHVKKALEGIDGVAVKEVNLKEKKAVIALEKDVQNDVIANAVNEAGYKVTAIRE